MFTAVGMVMLLLSLIPICLLGWRGWVRAAQGRDSAVELSIRALVFGGLGACVIAGGSSGHGGGWFLPMPGLVASLWGFTHFPAWWLVWPLGSLAYASMAFLALREPGGSRL
jgi:hypothetical protein